MVLAGVQRDAVVGQAAAHPCVARQRVRVVVVAGIDGLHLQRLREPRDLVNRRRVAHDQAGILHPVARREIAQLQVQLGQTGVEELDAAVGAQAAGEQRIEDGAVVDKHAPDLPGRPQCVVQRRLVVDAQVAAKPCQRLVERLRRSFDQAVFPCCFHAASLPQE